MAQTTEQKAGLSATLAIVAAIGSFLITFTGHPVWGVLAALVALPLGIFGLIRSASPRVGGGLMSVLAIVLGIFAIGVAILGMIGVIIF